MHASSAAVLLLRLGREYPLFLGVVGLAQALLGVGPGALDRRAAQAA
ncbi:DoxX family protein [Mizugakiibacter sediminis]|uniref:DoxX family protein n=1 Tax=Mizugakiibacter sediminis TaxID=1475481 RepID=A0A0K8QKM1_9GAMM|nr:hypothetical protein [Mizugakiibacter sediminis]GAP65408.1 DoxX family protein [Mizugakiibacter sediminis]